MLMTSMAASGSKGKQGTQDSSPRRVRFAPKASLKTTSRIDAKGVPEDELEAHFEQLLKEVRDVAVAMHQDEHVKAYIDGRNLDLCCDHEIDKASEQIWKGLLKEGVLNLRKVEDEGVQAKEEVEKLKGEVANVKEEGLSILKAVAQKGKSLKEAYASEFARLSEELALYKAEAEEKKVVEAQAAQLTARMATVEEKFQKASLEAGQLRAELSALKINFAELRTQNANVVAEMADLTTKNSQLYAENTTYRLRGLTEGYGSVETAIKVEGD